MQDITNFMPDLDVGQVLFCWGRENVSNWLSQFPLRCHVSGASLGGILATMFSMSMPERFDQVYAINPPGFRNIDGIDDDRFQVWKNAVRKPNIYVLSQQSDPVSQVGYFINDDHVHLYSVRPAEQKCKIPVINNWVQHLVIQLAHEGSILEPQSVEKRNQRFLQGMISSGCFDVIKPWRWGALCESYPEHTRVILEMIQQNGYESTSSEIARVESPCALGKRA